MARRVRIIARGIVQGVGFRMYARQEATQLGLCGYVRNLPDGAVEIVAEGDKKALVRLIAWSRHGPSAAVVEDVGVEDADATGEFGDFAIRH